MKFVTVAIFLTLFTSCKAADPMKMIELLELDPCEIGHVDFKGQLDLNPIPLITSNIYLDMHEEQTAETRPASCSE